MTRIALCTLLATAACVCATSARAHGFGQRYDLPIPLWLYLLGAVLTIVLSCVMLAVYVRAAPPGGRRSVQDPLAAWRFNPRGVAPILVAALRSVAVALYALVLAAGFLGNQSPLKNIAPVLVWAVWWVGMAYVCALLVDVWRLASPLDTIYRAIEPILARAAPRRGDALLALPERVGAWPAVALFLLFAWMEVAWDRSDHPAPLAAAICAYSIATWIAMFAFGRERWLRSGEAFACVFSIMARFAPTALRFEGARLAALELRPYGSGLVAAQPVSASQKALVILMLASVTFDGFLETPAWADIAQAAESAFEAGPAVRTLGLITAPLLFYSVYELFCASIARAGGSSVSRARLSGLFVLTLVPIAIAYHVAHYLSFLFMAGQYLIPLASDPFGIGWDLFGTRNHFVRLGLLDAKAVWYLSVTAIVTGHVAALYLAHVVSLREFPGRRQALRSQLPMVALMIAYTLTSLWIIAQPIVTSR